MALTTTLFDMDGLLLDSEILWHEAELEILGGLGVPLAQEGSRSTKGMFVAEVVAYWRERSPWVGPSNEDVVERILQRVGDLVETKGRLLPGAERAITVTAERGRIGLASSTPVPLIERCLAHFGLRDRFEVICSGANEPYGKPHPGVFLTAARALVAQPTQCLVFEDSAAGVLAAKAGRMMCVAVPVIEDLSLPAFALADVVLESLVDLDEAWLDMYFDR